MRQTLTAPTLKSVTVETVVTHARQVDLVHPQPSVLLTTTVLSAPVNLAILDTQPFPAMPSGVRLVKNVHRKKLVIEDHALTRACWSQHAAPGLCVLLCTTPARVCVAPASWGTPTLVASHHTQLSASLTLTVLKSLGVSTEYVKTFASTCSHVA